MKIINYDEVNDKQWDDFVQKNTMGHTYHLYNMMKYDWYNEHQNISFAILDENNDIVLISMLYLRIKDQTFIEKLRRKKKTSFLFSRWGYVIKDNLTAKQINTVKAAYMNHIDDIIKKYRVKSFEIALPPFCDAFRPENCPIVNPLIHFGFEPKQRYTYIIDLSKGEKEIFAGYESSSRNLINKTIRQNSLEIYESSGSEEEFELFKKIHIDCYAHSGGHLLAVKYLRTIFDAAREKQYCRLFFISEAGEPKAAIMLMFHKDSVYYLWGFSKNETPRYINKYFLHSLIMQMSEKGYRWFEVGGALPWLREGKYKGLNDYKKSFSRKIHPIFAGFYVKDKK